MKNDKELREKVTKAWGIVDNHWQSSTASFPKEDANFDNIIFPIAKKVAAKTIGQDLVGVKPMSSPGMKNPELLEVAKNKLKITNRQIITDNLINNTSNPTIDIEDIKEYKDYLNSSGTGLIYSPFVYVTNVAKVEGDFKINATKKVSSRYYISGEK